MQNDDQKLLIGATAWQLPSWQDGFYPPDLPQDWRLAYYANEFSTVLIRQGDTQAIAELEDLFDDEALKFHFVYEIDLGREGEKGALPEQSLQQALGQLAAVKEHCVALLLRLPASLQNEPALRMIAAQCEAFAPCCVDGPQAWSSALLDVLRELGMAVCWHVDPQGVPVAGFAGSALALAILTGETPGLPALRRVVENCISVAEEKRDVVLLFDGSAARTELMHQAGVIAELL